MIIRSRAPLRLGLAGGGTDLSPYCDLYGGCVLNATIDLYAYASIDTEANGKIKFIASDLREIYEAPATDFLPLEEPLALHKAVYNRIVRQFRQGRPLSVAMTTFCDARPGSGLGSSSTLVVAMVKAFVETLRLPLGEYDIARLAFEIERLDLGLSGGRQDQYAATFGGFNFMEFHPGNHILINPLRVKNWIISELESSLVLFYSGASRASAAIIERQIENVRQSRQYSVDAMHELKQESLTMKEAVLKGDFATFAGCLKRSWEAKKQTADCITNSRLEQLYQLAMDAGSTAGKLSGAGGGGFFMFFVPPDKRMAVIHALRDTEGEVVLCHFTKHGSEGWTID